MRNKTIEILIGVALICLGNIGFFDGAVLGVIHAVFLKIGIPPIL